VTFTIDLDGQCALVTGAGQGIGLAISHALGRAGASLLVNDVRAEQADAAVSELRAAGVTAEPVPFDVTDHAATRAAVAAAGPVSILVNNAGNAGTEGFAPLSSFVDTEPAEWQRFFAINLFGVMHCTHAVLPAMIDAGWGRIVTIVSDASRAGNAKLAPYAAAKAGAAGFCRSIAREVGRHAITVNCVSLGTIVTPTTRPPADTPEARAAERALLQDYVIRRRGLPEDAAGLVTYLASPLAEWITGQTYPVNGGYTFAL
jgi:NAD(P)-dependent dehydrogenase (short-subunit alcohol dehydrogenase family)